MDDELMSGAEVARLANVGRAAVSNWKKRFPDFPADCGLHGQPLYRRAEVSSWLEAHRKEYAVPRKGNGADQRVNSAVREIQRISGAFSEPTEIARLVAVLRRLACPEIPDSYFPIETGGQ